VSEARIHPTAVIHPSAVVESGAEVGPYCILGKNVRVGAGTVLHAHVIIEQNTTVGRDCQIHGGAIIGGPPQDSKFKNEESFLTIGDGNIIREFVTIHRATGEGNLTRLGNHNMLMAYAHIGHNCDIGNHVTLASYVGISGHVTIEDSAFVGGMAGIHQFCRIGTLVMIGGLSGVVQDIPPYMLANGRPARVYDINKIGLRRAGISIKVRNELREAYKLLYRSNLNMSQALETIAEEIESSPELEHLLEFIHSSRNGKNMRGNADDH
jgi:UDP-N-acetylglucosamine acyltransferase